MAVNGIIRKMEGRREVKTPAQDIGELVMQSLKKIDKIPYIRYTSVYKRLDEIAEFEVIFEQG